jgi:hypothetical protein
VAPPRLHRGDDAALARSGALDELALLDLVLLVDPDVDLLRVAEPSFGVYELAAIATAAPAMTTASATPASTPAVLALNIFPTSWVV